MPDVPNFPIPSELTPDTFCLQIQCPNNDDWKRVLLNVLSMPSYWFNWERDSAHSGKILSDYWTKIVDTIDWNTMSCCCDQPPAIFRYNSDGVYQRSTDGGVTWVDAPQYDYRNTSTTFPPPSALGFDNTKCQNADSMVQVIKIEIVDALNTSFAVAQILALIAAVLLAILSAGSLAAITPLITGIGAAIIDVGVTATQAAFTDDVWNRFRCNIFNHMTTDDSTDEAGLTAIITQINATETGIAASLLRNIVNAAGLVGVNNMIRSNRGNPDADCSACDVCVVTPYIPPGGGTMDSREGCVITATSFDEGGHQALYLWIDNGTSTYDPTLGGIITNVVVLSGSITLQGYNEKPSGTAHFPSLTVDHVELSQAYWQSSAPFQLQITVDS